MLKEFVLKSAWIQKTHRNHLNPQILILGPDRRIQNLLNALASNLHLYDPDLDLDTNLEQILEITLPKPQNGGGPSIHAMVVEFQFVREVVQIVI